MTKGFNRGLAGLLMSAALLAGAEATAAELPKATQQILKALNISPDDKIVANLNEEANSTPPDILAAANKEGEVNISGSINDEEFRELIAPFRERFPNVKVKYFSADQNDRNIKPLIAEGHAEGRTGLKKLWESLADTVAGKLGLKATPKARGKAKKSSKATSPKRAKASAPARGKASKSKSKAPRRAAPIRKGKASSAGKTRPRARKSAAKARKR